MKIRTVLMSIAVGLFALAMVTFLFAQEKKKGHDDHEQGHHEHQSKYPEVDKFHELLHPIWHEQYPAKEWAKIRQQSDELLKRKDAIMRIRLRVKPDDQAKAEELRKKFGTSVDELSKISKSGTDEELQKSVAAMHEAFENFADAIR